MLCQVFGKVPGTKQPSGEYTNRFHGNSYVPNTRQGEERLPWDHTHQKVVFPVYELRMYAENHAHEGHCRCEEYCMRIAARENYHRLFYDNLKHMFFPRRSCDRKKISYGRRIQTDDV